MVYKLVYVFVYLIQYSSGNQQAKKHSKLSKLMATI